MKLKLKYKFFLSLIVTGIIPIIILGTIGFFLAFNFAKNTIIDLENNLINQKINEINNFFKQNLEILEIIIAVDANETVYFTNPDDYYLTYDLNREKFILLQTLEQTPAILEISFLDLNGYERIKYYKHNNTITSADQVTKINPKAYFFDLAKNGKKFTSEVFSSLNGPFIIVANPLKSKDNKVIAILKTKLSLNQLNTIIGNSSLGSLGYVYLVDKNGYILYSSNNQLPQQINWKINNFEQFIKNKIQNLTKYKNFNNKPVYGLAQSLYPYGMYLIVEWPTQEANEIIYKQITLIIFSILTVVILTIILSFILAQIIIKPIDILKAGAKKVSEGKLEKIADIKTNDELEDLIKEFNFMIDGLIQFKKLKDEFVFMTAHELKAPMAAMKGYLTLLIDGTVGTLDKIAQEFIIKIKNANERLIQLVNDLLHIAKNEAETISINIQPVNISEAILPIINEFKIDYQKKNITLDYQISETLPKINANLDKLKEIFANLISNAIKYNIENGKIIIYHKTEGDYLLTIVQDTGLGIPKNQQEKIFQKFFRVQSKITENIPGTGLGLFIVKELVEKMNGKIWFESEEGKGTTFFLAFKIANNNK
ncbi:MAG: hypothetical protein KatS3mg097_136 [Candidatus Parcubacteria bacterium]|nr:MAG: hypothetical protein KatS3mg097_136 [Candidatus Parcubacteria bacterium]